MSDKIYNVELPSSGEFIAIKHGETGYYKTTIYTQEHADELNRRQGITAAQAEAAMMCSMNGNWGRLEEMATLIERQQVAA